MSPEFCVEKILVGDNLALEFDFSTSNDEIKLLSTLNSYKLFEIVSLVVDACTLVWISLTHHSVEQLRHELDKVHLPVVFCTLK